MNHYRHLTLLIYKKLCKEFFNDINCPDLTFEGWDNEIANEKSFTGIEKIAAAIFYDKKKIVVNDTGKSYNFFIRDSRFRIYMYNTLMHELIHWYLYINKRHHHDGDEEFNEYLSVFDLKPNECKDGWDSNASLCNMFN